MRWPKDRTKSQEPGIKIKNACPLIPEKIQIAFVSRQKSNAYLSLSWLLILESWFLKLFPVWYSY
jgi:hypothetical protein